MLYDMDAIEENQQAVEDGDAYYCDGCNELSEGPACDRCHDGVCSDCGAPVARGEGARYQVGRVVDVFCARHAS